VAPAPYELPEEPKPVRRALPRPKAAEKPEPAVEVLPAPPPPPEPVETEAPPEDDAATSPAESEKVQSAASLEGRYSIQVAAFKSASREEARDFVRQVEKTVDLPVALMESGDGEMLRVFVGSFKKESQGREARDELRKRKGFEDCWLKKLP
jgi:cell division septation protein DedD